MAVTPPTWSDVDFDLIMPYTGFRPMAEVTATVVTVSP